VSEELSQSGDEDECRDEPTTVIGAMVESARVTQDGDFISNIVIEPAEVFGIRFLWC
jgi:hypothetical protein